MTKSRSTAALMLGLAIAAAAGCTSDHTPLSPAATEVASTPDASLLGGLLGGVTSTTTGLLSCKVWSTTTASATIGSGGGVVRVGRHSLVVPPGALSSPTTITATAPRGNTVLVEFEPKGLKFDRPTALTLSYRDCGLLGGLLLNVVYVDGNQRVLETLPSLNNLLNMTVTGRVDHFSGYALADRKGTSTTDSEFSGSF